MTPAVSTIIPVLNDAILLRRCLTALKACSNSHLNQIIVADGGGEDSGECHALAEEFGAEYLVSDCGRARQINVAAEIARGEWLWFLHADCVPDSASISAMMELDGRATWGCFRHRIDAPSLALRVIEAADNLRARMGTPFGDQGIFVKANIFRTLGGFEPVPILEDVLLARRLKEGVAPRVLKPVLTADARRWSRLGILRTTLTNWRILFAFSILGKSPNELAEWYRK